MSNKDDGGPAFPGDRGGFNGFNQGMSLRDLFAGLAMQGQLYRSSTRGDLDIVRYAYHIADHMLEERKK